MKNLFFDYLKIVLTVSVVGIVLSSCMSSRITDANQGVTINSEREAGYTSNYVVCVQSKDGVRYSLLYNVHCYRPCVAREIPESWNIITLKSGKVLIEPIK